MTTPHPDDALPLVSIRAGDLVAVFAPTRGGRMLSLRVADEELLWRNPTLVDDDLRPVLPVASWPRGDAGMGSWANVGGSKTWPAPQGWSSPDEWAGPPDPVLDAGPWAVVDRTERTVVLRSPVDPRTGLRFERRFTVHADGLDERIRMTNQGPTVTRWAPWEVCQVRTDDGGLVVVPGATGADEVDLGLWEGALDGTAVDAPVRLPVGTGVAKRGYRGGTAVAYRRRSGTVIALTAVEEPDDGAVYPDGGCRFEVWLQRPVAEPLEALEGLRPDAHLVELEVLGRRTPLAPGARRDVTIRWRIERPVRC